MILKLWMPKEGDYGDPFDTYTEPENENCEQYEWNGECLLLQVPEFIRDVTPQREIQVRESISGTPYISSDRNIERYDLIWELRLSEKERKALEGFLEAVGNKTRDGFPYPKVFFAGELLEFVPEDCVITFMPQELIFTEYDTEQERDTEHEGDFLTHRRYTVDLAVRISDRIIDSRLETLDNQYIVTVDFPETEEDPAYSINLGQEYIYKYGVYGWLKTITGISFNSQVDGFGSISNITITLAMYNQYNTLPERHPFRNMSQHIERLSEATVTVSYKRVGKSTSDILFKGKAYTPYRWDEASMELSFDCVMNAKSEPINFQFEFQGFPINENWPHVFGQGTFKFRPLANRPSTKTVDDVFITRDYSWLANYIYQSGTSFDLNHNPEQNFVPFDRKYYWSLDVEREQILLTGQIEGYVLNIDQFNLPLYSDIDVIEIEQYTPEYVDSPNYQPSTILLKDTPPYLVGNHIKATAKRDVWIINELGQFVMETQTITYWATIINQDQRVLYLDNIKAETVNVFDEPVLKEITLSGWITYNIEYIMSNRMFEPNSFSLLPVEEVKNQRSDEYRHKYIDNEFGSEQHLAVHIKSGAVLTCLNWNYDKIYPISLDAYTVINNAELVVDDLVYPIPVKAAFSFKDGEMTQYTINTGWSVFDDLTWWDIQLLLPYLPDECTILVLGEHYEEIQANVVNGFNTEYRVFEYMLSRYTDIEYKEDAPEEEPNFVNFITYSQQDVRQFLGEFAKEHGKRIILNTDRTARMIPLFSNFESGYELLEIIPEYIFNVNNVEANSISFDTIGVEDINNRLKIESDWVKGYRIFTGDQRYPKQETSFTIKDQFIENVWLYWADWSSRVWRKITFKTFLNNTTKKGLLPMPLETIELSGISKGIVFSVDIEGDSVTITMISEMEVI